MLELGEELLELRQAAISSGVHYQTVYRWVRSGRLPAQLVGGKYLVKTSDLEVVKAERTTPVSPAPPGLKRLQRQSERMQEALLTGDETDVRNIASRLVGEGTTVVELIQVVIAPPLRYIGQAWHDGQISISVEHRAAAIVERLLGELAPNPRGRRRGTAMVASVAGDQHSLPTTMATVALREANWFVHHLGANMPSDELVRFCHEHEVDFAVISLTNPDATELAHRTAEALRGIGVKVSVGGTGRSLSDLVSEAASRARQP